MNNRNRNRNSQYYNNHNSNGYQHKPWLNESRSNLDLNFERPNNWYDNRSIWDNNYNTGGGPSSSSSPWVSNNQIPSLWQSNDNFYNNNNNWQQQQQQPTPLFTRREPRPSLLWSNRPKKRSNSASASKSSSQPTKKAKKVSPIDENVIIAYITVGSFPIFKIARPPLETLLQKIREEETKIDPKLFTNNEIRKGSLVVKCANQQGVDVLKKIVKDLSPFEGHKLWTVLPKKKNEIKWLALVPQDFPNKIFTTEEMDGICTTLGEELDKIAEDAFHPELLDLFTRRGAVIVSCNDEISVKWLKNTLPQLKIDLPKIIDTTELPIYGKFEIVLPCKQDEINKMLQRINRQNDGINTDDWFHFREVEVENGTLIYCSAEKQIINQLLAIDFTVFLNFSTIKMKYTGMLRTKYPIANVDEKELTELDGVKRKKTVQRKRKNRKKN